MEVEVRGDWEGEGPSLGDAPLRYLSDGWLPPFLLILVREGRGDLRGRDLADLAAVLGFGRLRPGEVYRNLLLLESEGLVASRRPGGGAENGFVGDRAFALGEPGEAYLEFWAHALAEYRGEIYVFLEAYYSRHARRDPGRAAPNASIVAGGL